MYIIKTFRKEYYYDVVKVKKYKLLRILLAENSWPSAEFVLSW